MTDAAPDFIFADPEPAAQPPAIRILAQYVRDLSFENPRAPDSLQPDSPRPQIELGVELNARGRPDALFELDLKLNLVAQRDEAVVFQLELVFGGLFQVTGVAEADLEQVLLIECPRYLFPFARRMVTDLTADGGFPPMMLEPIDFAAVYVARKRAEAGETGNA